MDFKQHFIYCNLFLYRIFLDQGLNLFIQTYYKEIGPEIAFNIWWMFFYIVNIGKNTEVLCRHFVLKNLFIQGIRFLFGMKIYFDAKSRLQEFSGFRGRRYPGQECPRPPFIEPRRQTVTCHFLRISQMSGAELGLEEVQIRRP